MASTYLTRTESAGNRKIGTISVWVKRGSLGNQYIYNNWNTSTSGYQSSMIQFTSSDRLEIVNYQASGGSHSNIATNRLFRDVNAWYHIVINWDTTQSTSSNRYKMYVNGVQETSFSTSTYPSLNEDLYFNIGGSSNPLTIGSLHSTGGGSYFDGSMSHYHNIDGTAYDASTFGETDSTTGIWKPKTAPSVTYGTNGFFLKFENSASMGTDSAGSNNLTVNGTMTQLIDTPSNVFATGNSLIKGTNGNSNGNNTSTSGQNSWESMWTTLGVSSGKYYAEFKRNSSGYTMFGVRKTENITTFDEITGGTGGIGWQSHGSIYDNNVETHSGGSPYATYADGDIIGVAMDLDNSKIYFSKNGTWQNSGDPTSGSTGTGAISLTADAIYHFGFCAYNGSCDANFGNGYFGTTAVSSAQNPDDGIGIFEYDVPAGYRALCTKSINAEEYS